MACARVDTRPGNVELQDRLVDENRGLMQRGVQIELCGTMGKADGWTNEDLLPGIKVATDAMSRRTQLTRQGYVRLTSRRLDEKTLRKMHDEILLLCGIAHWLGFFC